MPDRGHQLPAGACEPLYECLTTLRNTADGGSRLAVTAVGGSQTARIGSACSWSRTVWWEKHNAAKVRLAVVIPSRATTCCHSSLLP